jgi:class 3 adenylate cyclase
VDSSASATCYLPPEVVEYPAKWLVGVEGANSDKVFLFFDRIEIGRFNSARLLPGSLLVEDRTVSSHHCVITQDPDGRCFIRDKSRNGTRVDGRRLSPNLTTDLGLGQVVSVGRGLRLRLEGMPPETEVSRASDMSTLGVSQMTTVTVLVGDIRNYTNLVRLAGCTEIQESVNRVFENLEREVEKLGGTLKEFQGDAIFAFWERNDTTECHASQACRAALHLSAVVGRLAADPEVWGIPSHPLAMDFALATGLVTISGYGSDGAMGLSMVGESVVLAFRIEKFANEKTGPIIVCPDTMNLAKDGFKFKSIGKHQAKGFEEEHSLYALVRERDSG